MNLIRKITLKSLDLNVRIFAKYAETDLNYFADALSRTQLACFYKLAEKFGRQFRLQPEMIPCELTPIMGNLWTEH